MKQLLILAAVAMVFSGCGKNPKDSYLEGLHGLSQERALTFSGDYRTKCEEIQFNGAKVYQMDNIVFNDLEIRYYNSYQTGDRFVFTEESSLYEDSGCTRVLMTQSAKGNYRFGSDNKEMTLEASALKMTPRSSAMTSALNTKGFCGINWKTDSTEDLLNASCGPGLKTVNYFFNTHDSQARVIDLIYCADAEMTQCQALTYIKFK